MSNKRYVGKNVEKESSVDERLQLLIWHSGANVIKHFCMLSSNFCDKLCPRQTFPVQSNICGKGQSLPKWSTIHRTMEHHWMIYYNILFCINNMGLKQLSKLWWYKNEKKVRVDFFMSAGPFRKAGMGVGHNQQSPIGFNNKDRNHCLFK